MVPDALALSWVKWQFFAHLTFKSERLFGSADRIFFAWWRSAARRAHIPDEWLLWATRSELGETTGRFHLHALVAGLPRSWVNVQTCFTLRNSLERWGMARVDLLSPGLAGVDYILKGLDGLEGARLYEMTKIGRGPGAVTVSKSILSILSG